MKKSLRYSTAVVLIINLLILSVPFAPKQADAAVSNWQKGVSIQTVSTQDFASNNFKTSVNNAKAIGANYVTLIIPYYQSNTGSTDMAPGWNTPDDQTLITAINYVHSQGMKVMLKPHLESYDGQWRANINPGDRNSWFTNYGNILNHLADIGKQTGAEEFCIGAELISMSTYTSNGDNTQRWQNLIAGVRIRYSGALTYSANWGGDGFTDEKAHIGFWGSLDYIGISGYFNLYGSNDVNNLKAQWQNYVGQIKALSDNNNGKQILFTEIGYRSVSDAHTSPWDSGKGGSYDPTEQVNDYTALFQFWDAQPYMVGVQLWEWKSDPNAGGSGNTDYTPQGKPAQDTISSWFKNNPGTPSTPTPPSGGTAGTTAVNGSFTANGTVNPLQPNVNQVVNLLPNVVVSGTASNAIVDIEVYDNSGHQVFQKFFTGESFTQNQIKPYPVSWTPTTAGNYALTVGVFNQDWTKNYYWNAVNNFTVGTPASAGGTPPPSGGTNNPPPTTNVSFSATGSMTPNPAQTNQAVNIQSTLSSKGNLTNVLIDHEIYDASNHQVFQKVYDNQNFTATQPQTFNFSWTPTNAGTYTLKTGIFSSGWGTGYYWNDAVTTVSVGQATTPVTPPTSPSGNTGGTSTTTTPGGNTGGTTPTPPPTQTSYNTNIWWPTNGASVLGTTPLKAQLDGLDVAQYSMFWQVDGGALVQMSDSAQDYPHKEFLLDVSNWNWKGSGPYQINFVSKNPSGTVISQKAININVQH